MDAESLLDEHLADLLERIGAQCVIDVGANRGQYGQRLRRLGYSGWIVSFEPSDEAFAELEAAAAGDPRWRCVRCALGREDETRQLSVGVRDQFSSFLERTPYSAEEFGALSEVRGRTTVRVRSLDGCWDECVGDLPTARFVLKVDTQGFDLEVIEGARPRLRDCAALQLEASLQPLYEGVPGYLEALAHVNALGFDLTGVFPVVHDSRMRIVELDCVLINSRHRDANAWADVTHAERAARKEAERLAEVEQWTRLTTLLRQDLEAHVPEQATVALMDDARLGAAELAGWPTVPLIAHDGVSWGAPADDDAAVAALDGLRARGVDMLVVAWPAFWWLEHYPALADALRDGWRKVSGSAAAHIFRRRR